MTYPTWNDNGRVDGIHPLMMRAFNLMRKAAWDRHSINLTVYSGRRTFEEQTYLWNLYQSGRGNLAARPGTSNHEARGDGWAYAIDMDPDVRERSEMRALVFEFGFTLPISSEPWHIEPVWIRDSNLRSQWENHILELEGDEIVTDDDILKAANKVLWILTNPDGQAPGVLMGDGYGPINLTKLIENQRAMDSKLNKIGDKLGITF